MNIEDIIKWLRLGEAMFKLGEHAFQSIRAAMAAAGVDPALLAQLDDLYTQRIEQARRESAGFAGD